MKIFVIAGEASGDLHGSQLVGAIRRHATDAEFRFFGGDMMAEASGTQPLVHYRDMAYMGFVEVIKHLGTIMGFLKRATQVIDEWQPDAVVLIDYPSFNLKVAKYAWGKHIPVFYFISPKVWAWKEYRVKQIKKYITALYSILPFETEFFASHNYAVEYVGNPTVKEIADARARFAPVGDFCSRNGLDGRPIIALVPGSRRKEIADNLATMVRAASAYTDCQMVIAGAPGIPQNLYGQVLAAEGIDSRIPVLENQTFELVAAARVALVTSGTATLETAVLGTPQIVCYRMGGHRWMYFFYEHMLKVKYVSLPNLIVGREVIPEQILHLCNEQAVGQLIGKLLPDGEARTAMLNGYAEMNSRLGNNDCADTAARRLLQSITNK